MLCSLIFKWLLSCVARNNGGRYYPHCYYTSTTGSISSMQLIGDIILHGARVLQHSSFEYWMEKADACRISWDLHTYQ